MEGKRKTRPFCCYSSQLPPPYLQFYPYLSWIYNQIVFGPLLLLHSNLALPVFGSRRIIFYHSTSVSKSKCINFLTVPIKVSSSLLMNSILRVIFKRGQFTILFIVAMKLIVCICICHHQFSWARVCLRAIVNQFVHLLIRYKMEFSWISPCHTYPTRWLTYRDSSPRE